ncbi:MAG: hypothetical protein E4H14_19035 [Candidatus Thorarchaeota archaeon]|nr:MAG: hypothetical protein E4H14_19035 [Candidatus Thorarchaeota archaeon]
MPKWEAAVAIENPKILYQIVQLLKDLEIKFVICSPVDHRCEHAHLVITSPGDNSIQHIGRIEVTEDFDTDFVRIEIMSKLHNLLTPTKAIVGIDPGMTSGVALVIDGIPVYSNTSTSPEAVAILTKTLVDHSKTMFPESQKLIRIGTGSKLYAALLLRSIGNSITLPSIELVNEHKTTIISGARSDESAAILIAGRIGRPPSTSDLSVEPKEGYIRSLKRYVTLLTKGKKSITSNEARALLTGDSTLEDVIRQS